MKNDNCKWKYKILIQNGSSGNAKFVKLEKLAIAYRICKKCGRIEFRRYYLGTPVGQNKDMPVREKWVCGLDIEDVDDLYGEREPFCDPILSQEEIKTFLGSLEDKTK